MSARTLALIVAVVVTLLALGRARADERESGTILLAAGEQKVLPGDGVDSYSAATGEVVEVRLTETPDGRQQLILVGKAPGTTSLVLGLTNGQRLVYQVTVSQIRPRHNVRLDVYFVQVSRGRATRLGLVWPTSLAPTGAGGWSVGAAGAAPAMPPAVSVGVASILPRLDFAAENGWAKVLDHTRIVMANGDEGSYASGGELNIPVSGLSSGLSKVAYGSTITARVSFDPTTGRVEVRLQANLSRLSNVQGGAAPGVASTSVNTTVNMSLGESLALGGITSTQESSSSTGLAFLSEIPVLGYLFGGRTSSRDQNENVIFIVPSLVSPVALADRDRVTEALRLYARFDGGPLGGGITRLNADPTRAAPAVRR